MMRVIAMLVLASCSANDDFPGPRIAAIAPDHGSPTDDPLVCANTGTVQFGSATTTAVQYTDTTITAQVPNGAGAVDVSVTVVGNVSNSVRFTIE